MNVKEAGEGPGSHHEAMGTPLQQCPAHPRGCCSPIPRAKHRQEQNTNTRSPQDLEAKVPVNLILFLFPFSLAGLVALYELGQEELGKD